MKEIADISIDVNHYDFDATVKMIKAAFSFELWDEVIRFSESLYIRVYNALKEDHIKVGYTFYNSLNRTLVYYYGYSLLMKGTAFKKLGRYAEAKECITQYADLSWFENLNQDGLKDVEYFTYVAVPNRLEIELLLGNLSVLEDFISFLQNQHQFYEVLHGVIALLKTANTYKLNIDKELSLFSNQINELIKNSYKVENVLISLRCNFFDELTQYYVNKEDYQEAIGYCLHLLLLASKSEQTKIFKRAVLYMEELRDYVTPSQIKTYKSILKGEVQNEKIFINGNSIIFGNEYCYTNG
jgi:hypothetical protein